MPRIIWLKYIFSAMEYKRRCCQGGATLFGRRNARQFICSDELGAYVCKRARRTEGRHQGSKILLKPQRNKATETLSSSSGWFMERDRAYL